MPGKVNKDKVTWAGDMCARVGDKCFHQFTCGIRAQYMLYISRCPIAAFCIDQPLSECPCIIFCILQRSKGRILVGIDTNNDSQASAHIYPHALHFYSQQITWLLYDTFARVLQQMEAYMYFWMGEWLNCRV